MILNACIIRITIKSAIKLKNNYSIAYFFITPSQTSYFNIYKKYILSFIIKSFQYEKAILVLKSEYFKI